MNRKSMPVSILLCIFFVISLGAKDWWQKKPHGEWSEYDVSRMLDRSPWHRRVTVSGLRPNTLGSGSRPTNNQTRTSGPPPDRPDLRIDAGTWIEEGDFRVRFLSAKPMQLAHARDIVLAKNRRYRSRLDRLPSDEDMSRYIIVTVDPRSGSFSLNNLVEEKTLLTTRGGKQVPVARSTAFLNPARSSLYGTIVLFFPRTLPDGSPVFTLEDKEVQFETQIRGVSFRATFKLKKMIFDGKLEL